MNRSDVSRRPPLAFAFAGAAAVCTASPGAEASPRIPVYDGCVVADRVRIVTGPKRVVDRHERPYDRTSG